MIGRRPRRRWSQHRTSCKRRSSAVRALTVPQGAVWLLGRSLRVRAYIDSNLHRTIHIRDLECGRASKPGALDSEIQTGCWRSRACLRGEKASRESLPPDDHQCGTTERNSLERWLFGSSTSMQTLQTGLWSKSGPLATRARNAWRGHLKNRHGREYPMSDQRGKVLRFGARNRQAVRKLQKSHLDP